MDHIRLSRETCKDEEREDGSTKKQTSEGGESLQTDCVKRGRAPKRRPPPICTDFYEPDGNRIVIIVESEKEQRPSRPESGRTVNQKTAERLQVDATSKPAENGTAGRCSRQAKQYYQRASTSCTQLSVSTSC